jgi:hypothetical protein
MKTSLSLGNLASITHECKIYESEKYAGQVPAFDDDKDKAARWYLSRKATELRTLKEGDKVVILSDPAEHAVRVLVFGGTGGWISSENLLTK